MLEMKYIFVLYSLSIFIAELINDVCCSTEDSDIFRFYIIHKLVTISFQNLKDKSIKYSSIIFLIIIDLFLTLIIIDLLFVRLLL